MVIVPSRPVEALGIHTIVIDPGHGGKEVGAIGPDSLLARTCNPALTNFTLSKLLWVRAHEPDRWRRVEHVLLPKDYVRFRLSDTLATDVTDVDQVKGLVDAAVKTYGRIDVMLNNAGLMPQSPLDRGNHNRDL